MPDPRMAGLPAGRRVLRWDVPLQASADGHTVKIGGGPVVLCTWRPERHVVPVVEVWTDEVDGLRCEQSRNVVIVGTGHEVPAEYRHIGSTVMDDYVWHCFEVPS